MTALARAKPRKLTVQEFLAFYDTRPDEEQWQLVDGIVILMTPPFVTHQIIASNLQRLINDFAERESVPWRVYQRTASNWRLFPTTGLNLTSPVIDLDIPPNRRYVDRFYLVAEVLSSSCDERILLKRRFYRSHDPNQAILLFGQERMELELDRRTADGWATELLTGGDAFLDLPAFGLACPLRDLYRNTRVPS